MQINWQGVCVNACNVIVSNVSYLYRSLPNMCLYGPKLTDPDLYYPFDEVVDGQIVGSTPGMIGGDASLVEGRVSQAVYTDGIQDQYVNLGNLRQHCVGDLRLCQRGLTISLWLRPHVKKSGTFFYFTNGGHTRMSIGVVLMQKYEGFLVSFRNDTGPITISHVPFESQVWHFITMVWGPNSGVRLYLNGCLAGEELTLTQDASDLNGPYNDFVLGASNIAEHRSISRAEMTMDELKIWDARMTGEQVWDLYMSHIWFLSDSHVE